MTAIGRDTKRSEEKHKNNTVASQKKEEKKESRFDFNWTLKIAINWPVLNVN